MKHVTWEIDTGVKKVIGAHHYRCYLVNILAIAEMTRTNIRQITWTNKNRFHYNKLGYKETLSGPTKRFILTEANLKRTSQKITIPDRQIPNWQSLYM